MPESFVGKKWRNVWLFRNSVFKDWSKESEEMIQHCFQMDWDNCQVHKIITDMDDYNLVYSKISDCYQLIFNTYKQLSSISPIADVFCISQMIFLDMICQSKIVDEKLIDDSELNNKLQ